MSSAALEWAYKQKVILPPSKRVTSTPKEKQKKRSAAGLKAVLAYLAHRANKDGECWPSVRTIAREAQLSPRGVQYAIKTLTAAGLLRVDTRFSDTGRRTSNVYVLCIPASAAEAHPVRGDHASGASGTTHRVRGQEEQVIRTKKKKVGSERQRSLLLPVPGGKPAGPETPAGLGWDHPAEAALFEMIGSDNVNAWFGGARLQVGPPHQIEVAGEARRRMIEDRFSEALARAFGGDAVTLVRRAPEAVA